MISGYFQNKQLKPIAQWLPQSSPVLNATFCQIDPEYVAFNSGNQLFIDKFEKLTLLIINKFPY
jgi:hypothetical protein